MSDSERQLVGMGFPRERVASALSLHGNDFEAALNQLVSEDKLAAAESAGKTRRW